MTSNLLRSRWLDAVLPLELQISPRLQSYLGSYDQDGLL